MTWKTQSTQSCQKLDMLIVVFLAIGILTTIGIDDTILTQ